MRVSRLIELLKDCPPDAHVAIDDPYDPESDWTAPAHITEVYVNSVDLVTLNWWYDND